VSLKDIHLSKKKKGRREELFLCVGVRERERRRRERRREREERDGRSPCAV
jgi:hypothetical protein